MTFDRRATAHDLGWKTGVKDGPVPEEYAEDRHFQSGYAEGKAARARVAREPIEFIEGWVAGACGDFVGTNRRLSSPLFASGIAAGGNARSNAQSKYGYELRRADDDDES